jgi:hypothetical protein
MDYRMKIVTIPVTELRTGDRIPQGKGSITLGKLLDHRDPRERAFAAGPITERGGSYVTWRASGTVDVIR